MLRKLQQFILIKPNKYVFVLLIIKSKMVPIQASISYLDVLKEFHTIPSFRQSSRQLKYTVGLPKKKITKNKINTRHNFYTV